MYIYIMYAYIFFLIVNNFSHFFAFFYENSFGSLKEKNHITQFFNKCIVDIWKYNGLKTSQYTEN